VFTLKARIKHCGKNHELKLFMSTRKKLYFFIGLAALLLLIACTSLHYVVNNKVTSLMTQQMTHTKEETLAKLSAATSGIRANVDDNTQWDEMVNYALHKKSGAWLDYSLRGNLHQYNADFSWILDQKGRYINGLTYKKESPIYPLSLSGKFLDSAKSNRYFAEFYQLINGQLVNVYLAPIQDPDDIGRKRKPHGFYAMGRIIDSAYLAKLSQESDEGQLSLVAFTGAIAADRVDAENCTLELYTPLNMIGEGQYAIKTVKVFEDIQLFSKYLTYALLAFFLIMLIASFFLYSALSSLVFKPMQHIALALKNGKTKDLEALMRQQNEFGELANMIGQSFSQKQQLEKEIDIRANSELALKNAIGEVEKSTIDKVKAEESAASKSEFLSIMSHEIRTPINGVVGIANLLLNENLPPHIKDYIKTLKFSSDHLLALVTDILDFSKIENGSIELEHKVFNLAAVCHNVAQLYQTRAQEKNLKFNFLFDDLEKVNLMGDAVRLSQVLTNLVSNAIKFTEAGQVDFLCTVEQKGAKATVNFVVLDSGIGIKKEELPKIFNKFSQANRSITSKFGGTGLGLTISKKLIDLQGGQIEVSSEAGKGSRFHVQLTYEVAVNEKPLEAKPLDETKGGLKGMKILVVEDNPVNVMVLQKFLVKWDVDVTVANNGKEALEKVMFADFDTILMDLHMPEMDGREATRIIRNNTYFEKASATPIAALTADASLSTKELLLQEGFQHYITKPFNPGNLFNILKQYKKSA
jgi:signal transduction histidine kinase/CheY-like chemotaxis protein